MTGQLYKGYEILMEMESGEALVYKRDKLVHRAKSHKAAVAWINERDSGT